MDDVTASAALYPVVHVAHEVCNIHLSQQVAGTSTLCLLIILSRLTGCMPAAFALDSKEASACLHTA